MDFLLTSVYVSRSKTSLLKLHTSFCNLVPRALFHGFVGSKAREKCPGDEVVVSVLDQQSSAMDACGLPPRSKDIKRTPYKSVLKEEYQSHFSVKGKEGAREGYSHICAI